MYKDIAHPLVDVPHNRAHPHIQSRVFKDADVLSLKINFLFCLFYLVEFYMHHDGLVDSTG